MSIGGPTGRRISSSDTKMKTNNGRPMYKAARGQQVAENKRYIDPAIDTPQQDAAVRLKHAIDLYAQGQIVEAYAAICKIISEIENMIERRPVRELYWRALSALGVVLRVQHSRQ